MSEVKFTKIDAIVAGKGVQPSDCLYHTTRRIQEGKIRILALKSDNIARCEYVCPKCMKYGYSEAPWQRPFKIDCVNCGSKIAVPKMKEQYKREMKQAQKAGKG
jgi:DNA-directed RNA polymerase subunit RPC12/RpoP